MMWRDFTGYIQPAFTCCANLGQFVPCRDVTNVHTPLYLLCQCDHVCGGERGADWWAAKTTSCIVSNGRLIFGMDGNDAVFWKHLEMRDLRGKLVDQQIAGA